MPLLEWSDALSVGFAEMDEDHKKLVEILNTLNDAVERKERGEVIEEILEELVSYTQWHFRHEERLMQEFEYEGIFEHKKEHKDLTAQAVELFEKYQNGDVGVPSVLLPFLKDWLTNHILGTDKQTGAFLAAQV